MSELEGELITPPNYDEEYIYRVDVPEGMRRMSNAPRIEDNYKLFILEYQKDETVTEPDSDDWGLRIFYTEGAPERDITVEFWLDGVKKKGDVPRVQDGM